MIRRALGDAGFDIAPVVLGGNVFGWTIDAKTSFDVLDAFVDHGFDAIDTADVYSRWKPGNEGGESEAIIGQWLKARPGARQRVRLFTKVGMDLGRPGEKGLSARWIAQAVEASLRRLGVETIDLYFSHFPDADAPHEETLGAYEKLLRAGKIKAIGASNFDAGQLGSALDVARRSGLPRYTVLQPLYNLYDREGFEGPLRDLCLRENVGVVCYYGLAAGYLTGKYRSKDDLARSQRGAKVANYMTPRGEAILSTLDKVAAARGASLGEIALAWLIQRAGVTAPIASATSVAQVESLGRAAAVALTPEDVVALDAAGA